MCEIITSRTLLPCDLTLVDFGNVDGCFAWLLWVAYHSYDFEMDTEKQRQRRHDDAWLTESGNARSEQLNTRGAYRVANQQNLACLSGSERQRPGWFLDMKYQTCWARTQELPCKSQHDPTSVSLIWLAYFWSAKHVLNLTNISLIQLDPTWSNLHPLAFLCWLVVSWHEIICSINNCTECCSALQNSSCRSLYRQVESGGTVLSTNWKEVGSSKVERKPPDGMEWKNYEYWHTLHLLLSMPLQSSPIEGAP